MWIFAIRHKIYTTCTWLIIPCLSWGLTKPWIWLLVSNYRNVGLCLIVRAMVAAFGDFHWNIFVFVFWSKYHYITPNHSNGLSVLDTIASRCFGTVSFKLSVCLVFCRPSYHQMRLKVRSCINLGRHNNGVEPVSIESCNYSRRSVLVTEFLLALLQFIVDHIVLIGNSLCWQGKRSVLYSCDNYFTPDNISFYGMYFCQPVIAANQQPLYQTIAWPWLAVHHRLGDWEIKPLHMSVW